MLKRAISVVLVCGLAACTAAGPKPTDPAPGLPIVGGTVVPDAGNKPETPTVEKPKSSAGMVKPTPKPSKPKPPKQPQSAPKPELVIPPCFAMPDAERLARELASRPYVEPKSIPDSLRSLSFEQWKKLAFRPERTLWLNDGLPFGVQFFHPGSMYENTVRVHIVDGDNITPVTFDRSMFAPDSELDSELKNLTLGFAGIRVVNPQDKSANPVPLASFVGATYFRGTAKGIYGVEALGLTADTGRHSVDCFPYFGQWWIVKPRKNDPSLTMYALMDAPLMTGAYRFVLNASGNSDSGISMDVACILFAREHVKDFPKFGIAPLVSMFLSGDKENRHVHKADVLLLKNGDLWSMSPLQNPRRLEPLSFDSDRLKGFGLIQREKRGECYKPVPVSYALRPSAWVEPLSDWGKSRIVLTEFPTNTAVNNNVFAYFEPETPRLYSISEENTGISYAYRIVWLSDTSGLHDLGRVVRTAVKQEPHGKSASFEIDFSGGVLDSVQPGTGLSCKIDLPNGAVPMDKRLVKVDNGAWRLSFSASLPKQDGVLKNILPLNSALPPLRFKAFIRKGDNLPAPITEIWTYDLRR